MAESISQFKMQNVDCIFGGVAVWHSSSDSYHLEKLIFRLVDLAPDAAQPPAWREGEKKSMRRMSRDASCSVVASAGVNVSVGWYIQ